MLFVTWVLHIVSTFVYYYYSLSHPNDGLMYYNDPLHFYQRGFLLGTWWVIYFVQSLKRLIGGTYLDYCLLFEAFGFWGIALIMRTIEEIYQRFRVKPPDGIFIICWLPGLHFWTSNIGKDSFLLLACSLAVWSVMAPRKRWPGLATAFVIMLMFRAHIALIAVIAISAAIFLNKKKTFVEWIALGVAFACLVLTVLTLKRAVALDISSVQSVSDYFEARTSVSRAIAGGSAVLAPFPLRLISLFFRPFFFDAVEIFGFVSSLENVVMVFLLARVIWGWRIRRQVASQVFAVRFWWLFFVSLAFLLAFVYYNVGLGLRQRVMFMPALIATFATVLAVRKGRALASATPPQSPGDLRPAQQLNMSRSSHPL